MTPEQLQSVRADRWRQKSNPVLTLEDATSWINTTGLCVFLPRRNQFLTPAPSFVEATIGAPSETPAPAAIANARSLMIRLIESSTALPLNLFGALSEQPDFLVSREVFPYIFSLRGGRNWKTPPPKATPLVTAIWKLLEKGASLEATEIQAALGHEITEAAVLRGLMDLWGGLRVMPFYSEDGPTRWELTQTRFEDALTTANRTAQTTGLSALVSLYLDSVVVATPEEIETFLSPLTARSKVREVVNGLAATRQLGMVLVGTQTMYHVAGSLPEFPEPEVPAEAAPQERQWPAREERRAEQRPPFKREREGERPRFTRSREKFAASSGERPPRRKPFGAGGGERPPFRKFGEGKPRTNYPRREEGSDRKPFTKQPFGQRSFEKRDKLQGAGSENRPFRSGGKYPPKKFGEGGGKFPPKKFGKPKFGAQKSGPPKFGAGRERPWRKDEGSGAAASEGRPFRPRREGDRPGKSRPYEAREKRPFFRDKGETGGKFEGRSGSREGSGPPRRDWKPKQGGFAKSGKPGFGKPKFGAKSGGFKAGAHAPGGAKFGGKKFGSPQSRGPSRGKFGGPRSGFKAGPKPGGMKPPFKKRGDKRKDEGNKSSE